MIRIRAVLAAFAVAVAAPAFGASPDPKDLAIPPEELSKARELVRRMGSESYKDREEAQAELAKLGRLAKQVLAEAVANDADPEIRLRASRLLPKAAAADLQARIDTFLADKEAKYEHDLPGLKAFNKSLATTDNKAKIRDLYVEILKTPYNMDMFSAMDKGDVEGGRAIADRRTSLFNDMQYRAVPPGGKAVQPRQPTLADIAALLFAESIVNSDNIPKTNIWNNITGVYFLQSTSAGQQALSGSGVTHAEAFKIIVRQWLATRTDTMELTNLSYYVGTHQTLKQWPETLVLLRRIVNTDGVQGYAKGQALNSIVQIQLEKDKDLKDKEFYKSLLTNSGQCQQVWLPVNGINQPAVMYESQLRDVALAIFILQSKQNMKDYGYTFQNGFVPQLSQVGYGQFAFTPSDWIPAGDPMKFELSFALAPHSVNWSLAVPRYRTQSAEEKRSIAFMKYGWSQLKASADAPPSKDGPKDEPKTEPKPDQPKDTPVIKPGVKPVRPLPAPVPAVPAPVAPAVQPAVLPAVEVPAQPAPPPGKPPIK